MDNKWMLALMTRWLTHDPILVNPFHSADLRRKQMIGRITPYIVVRSVVYLETLGNDPSGVPFADYDVSDIKLEPSDRFVCTLIDIRARAVIHVAVIVRSKTEACGSYVTYVLTRNGALVHRIAATESVIRAMTQQPLKVL